jgi:hypothetical protein
MARQSVSGLAREITRRFKALRALAWLDQAKGKVPEAGSSSLSINENETDPADDAAEGEYR